MFFLSILMAQRLPPPLRPPPLKPPPLLPPLKPPPLKPPLRLPPTEPPMLCEELELREVLREGVVVVVRLPPVVPRLLREVPPGVAVVVPT